MTPFSNFQLKICILKDLKYSNFRIYWNVISDQSERHSRFYKILLEIIWLFNVHFTIQGLKMAKTKVLSWDMRDRIIAHHKGGQGYQKICKEINPSLSTVGNIIRKYKKYGDDTEKHSKKWKTEKNKWVYIRVDQQKYANKPLHYSFWN